VIYRFSWSAFFIFAFFVAVVLALSFYLGRKAKSARGYYAAHGQIGWFVNGVAFAGDYLSAASFLGICGMIAFYGYDGFLYSIGYLAGWVVALFVIAEPIKRLGRFTFADALDAKFNSRGIKLAVAISTLVVSLFYLIPQMVGAGALVKPLLGLPHWSGVLIVGVTVILIVVTAGMVSTTWVQFIKGSLLVIFCTILVAAILHRGIQVSPELKNEITPFLIPSKAGFNITALFDNAPNAGMVYSIPSGGKSTGPLGPLEFLRTFNDTMIVRWDSRPTPGESPFLFKNKLIYQGHVIPGSDLLTPGGSPTFAGVRSNSFWKKLDFLSLMLALFCGTASLPHILIRYYTVKDAAAARKSTVVGIASIGFFYILTLYLGLGAMTSGALDPTDSNMAAPLLARSFNPFLFAVISAIAFTTVLGTVSGLIMAASGAVAHDLMANVLRLHMDDHQKVFAGKMAAIVVGILAMVLGVAFARLNVTFLVGWAFNIAASANLPALVMLLFWKRTTKQGITAAVTVGMLSSLAWILLSAQAYKDVYGLDPARSPIPFSQPGLVTIPLGFLVLVIVSLLTKPRETAPAFEVVAAK